MPKKKSLSEELEEEKKRQEELIKKLTPEQKELLAKKKSGCLKIFIIFILIITGFIAYSYLTYEATPLEKLFKNNDLGLVENVKETSWVNNGKILDFETRKIKYKAFIRENGEIYQLFVGKGKSFPIYDITTNDTMIDDNEKKIISRMENFWNKEISTLNGSVKYLVEDTKKHLNFPDTFKHEKSISFDMGKYYIINMSFISKNAFGMSIPAVAKYKIDFENNTYTLMDIIQ